MADAGESLGMASGDKRTETLVGLFLFIGLSLLGGLIMQYGRFSDKLKSVYAVTVEFKDASGVIKGSQVRLGGAMIGEVVQKPELGGNRKVKVQMAIRDDVPLPANSVFQITSLSLLGDKVIVVSIPEDPSPENLEDGAFLQGGGPSGLEAIQGDAERIAHEAHQFLTEARERLEKLDKVLDDLQSVAVPFKEGVEKINTGLLSEENIQGFGDSIASIKESARNVEEASQELKPLMVETRQTVNKVARVADEARGTFEKANSQIDNLEPALREVPEAIRNISEVAETASAAIGDIRNSDGLIGTLAYDKEIKNDSKTFVRNLRRHGILGYRDEETYDENDPRERFKGRRR